MLSPIFTNPTPNVFERNIDWDEAMEKYTDNYMIVTNSHLEDGHLHGDVIAILTPEEYFKLKLPESFLPKYEVWEGLNLKGGGLGVLGYYM